MKYKLIKTYPGSPSLNTICKYDKNPWSDSNAFINPVLNPENYPEFWEPVVEKDYEILSYISKSNTICTLQTNGKYLHSKNNHIVNFENYRIHSVKRLSDGKEEIFTIGDKTNNGTISKFEIDPNGVRVFFEEKPKNYHVSLNTIKHAKTALFRTEDGVDIYKGDTIWHTDISNFKTFSSIVEYEKPFEPIKGLFSTKEKAEEYILYNKPLLTLRDIEELLCKNTSSYFLEKFKKRAQKLNNKN